MSAPTAPRIAIVDDHELVALAIGELIRSDPALDYVGHASSIAQLFTWGTHIDLVVLDLSLRDGSEPSANVAALRGHGIEVLVLTSGENPYLIREVSQSGVFGIVRKSAPAQDILTAIAAAARGEAVITTEWAAAVDSDAQLKAAPLTERERQVLALYASGLGAKAVAAELGLSENTVDDHLRRIRAVYARVQRPANTKVELYQRGLEDGFMPIPGTGPTAVVDGA